MNHGDTETRSFWMRRPIKPALLRFSPRLCVSVVHFLSGSKPHSRVVHQLVFPALASAVGAAIQGAARFRAVTDDLAAAVRARRRQSVNRALERVENVTFSAHHDLERPRVIVAAGFAFRHDFLLAPIKISVELLHTPCLSIKRRILSPLVKFHGVVAAFVAAFALVAAFSFVTASVTAFAAALVGAFPPASSARMSAGTNLSSAKRSRGRPFAL